MDDAPATTSALTPAQLLAIAMGTASTADTGTAVTETAALGPPATVPSGPLGDVPAAAVPADPDG